MASDHVEVVVAESLGCPHVGDGIERGEAAQYDISEFHGFVEGVESVLGDCLDEFEGVFDLGSGVVEAHNK